MNKVIDFCFNLHLLQSSVSLSISSQTGYHIMFSLLINPVFFSFDWMSVGIHKLTTCSLPVTFVHDYFHWTEKLIYDVIKSIQFRLTVCNFGVFVEEVCSHLWVTRIFSLVSSINFMSLPFVCLGLNLATVHPWTSC